MVDRWPHSAEYFRKRRAKAREKEGIEIYDPFHSAIARQRGQELTMMMRTPVCLWPKSILDEFTKAPGDKSDASANLPNKERR